MHPRAQRILDSCGRGVLDMHFEMFGWITQDEQGIWYEPNGIGEKQDENSHKYE